MALSLLRCGPREQRRKKGGAVPALIYLPRVTISVSGHVEVSQMGIVQVPYATATVKYVRALMCDRELAHAV